MGNSFDPYREWLGIDGGRASADYYRVFGLPVFTADPQMIAAAAKLTIARVGALSPGAHEELQQRLLAQLEAARQCLLDRQAKVQYDEKLRLKYNNASAAQSRSPVAKAIPLAADSSSERSTGEEPWEEISRTEQRMNFARRRQASALSGPKIALGISGGLLLILAVIIYWRWNVEGNPIAQSPIAQSVATPPPKPAIADSMLSPRVEQEGSPGAGQADTVVEAQPAERASSISPPVKDESSTALETRLPSSEVVAVPRDKPASQPPRVRVAAVHDSAVDMEREATFEGALQQARAELVSRDSTAANRALEVAEKNLPAESRRAEVAALRTLSKQLGLFFEAVRSGWQKYETTEEIQWDGERAAIIEVGPDRVGLFIEGQRRDFTVATLPAGLALFFAHASADESAPQAQVFYGAFLAVDPAGDRARARTLWQQAKAAGMEVDMLLPLLDEPPLSERRQRVPPTALVDAARDKIQGRFAGAILAAKSGRQKARLASQILEAARGAKGLAEQYAGLDEAREWAISGGDPATALAAIDALGKTFEVDLLELKSEALGASIAGLVSTDSAAKAASAALALSDQAEQAGRMELAGTLADTAYTAARKAREAPLIRRAHERRQALSGKR